MESLQNRLDRLAQSSLGDTTLGVMSELKLEFDKEHLAGIKQDRLERKVYADRIFLLICVYLSAVSILVVLSGFCTFGFKLSDTILGILLGTTTANILTLFHFVARYLYYPIRPSR